MTENLLVTRNEYLSAGAHIGMKQHTADMKRFIFKLRSDGIGVLDVQKLDERIRVAARFIARSKKPLIASRKGIGSNAAKKFAEIIGGRAVTGRFYPGTMTNAAYAGFYEPDILVVIDPLIDVQPLREAVNQHVPVVALCDTFNELRNIDVAIPVNNKGNRSVALVFWLLGREVMKARGEIASNDDFKYKIEEFESEETALDELSEAEGTKERRHSEERRPFRQ